jgi:WD40 repeat protein
VKVWDAETGRELRTLSRGNGYRPVHSVAYSPDGRRIVSGSRDDDNNTGTIKIWDAETGQELRILSGQMDYVNSVAFSPDGRRIVSGAGAIQGMSGKNTVATVKIWDVETGRELRTLSGHSEYVTSAAFSPNGRYITSGSLDGTVKIWDPKTGRELRTLMGDLNGVGSVAFSPDSRYIIARFFMYAPFKVWDAETGRELYSLSGGFPVFSPDGRRIVSVLYDDDNTVRVWDAATGRELRTLSGHSKCVTSAAFSSDGRRIVSASDDNTVRVWDAESGRELRAFSAQGDNSGPGPNFWNIAFSPDGQRIAANYFDGTVMVWDTETGRELRTLSGGSPVFSPDGKTIVTDSSNIIKIWDAATGRELRTLSGHSGYLRSVAYSPDGKIIISCSSDSTTRLWDAVTGKEIAQFISFDDGEWIVITPDGYYNASPGGDRYLNVRVGNNVYGIDQYRAAFYKPNIVAARLGGGSGPEPVITIDDAVTFEPPRITIRNPADGGVFTAPQAELSVIVEDPKQPIKSIRVLVNGRQTGSGELEKLTGTRGLKVVAQKIEVPPDLRRIEFVLPIGLDPGNNRVGVIAFNGYSEATRTVDVAYRREETADILPNLWILAIGVNRYSAGELENLSYAVNDARRLIDAFKAQEGKRFRKVNSLLIADGAPVAPTAENIVNNLDYLRQAGQRDVVLLFMAGHGVNDTQGNFFFLPSDAVFNRDGSVQPFRAVTSQQINGMLDMPGKKLVFIDACHSEDASGRRSRGVDNNRLLRDIMDPSTLIFTSSTGKELSLETERERHGLFTYAIIEGMRGGADVIKDGVITMKELDAYVSARVPEMSGGAQHPVSTVKNGNYIDFVVADVR